MKRQPTPHPTQPDKILKPNPGEVGYRLILGLRREPLSPGNFKNQVVLWVVQWSSAIAPVLEKRRLYVLKDGTVRTYGQMGLTLEDWKYISEHWTSICEALQS